MNIMDLVALAKQGYTPAEVRDLLSMAQDPEPTVSEPEVQKTEPEESPQDTPEPEVVETINYKELYSSAMAEIDSLKTQLDTAQKHNTSLNIAPQNVATDEETINDLVRAFM